MRPGCLYWVGDLRAADADAGYLVGGEGPCTREKGDSCGAGVSVRRGPSERALGDDVVVQVCSVTLRGDDPSGLGLWESFVFLFVFRKLEVHFRFYFLEQSIPDSRFSRAQWLGHLGVVWCDAATRVAIGRTAFETALDEELLTCSNLGLARASGQAWEIDWLGSSMARSKNCVSNKNNIILILFSRN